MKDNEEIVAIPYNDHAIFLDEYGILSERVGLAWKKDKDIPDRLDNPYYIGTDDYWHIPAGAKDDFDDNQSSPIVAKRYPLKIYVMSLDILDIFHHLFLI